jgi:hypothetical protein
MRAYGMLAALTAVVHGLLLVTHYVIWDDLWLNNWIATGRLDYLDRVCTQAGSPLMYYFLAALSVFGDPGAAMHVIGFLCTFLRGALTYALLKRTRFLSAGEALLAAAVTVAFPSLKTVGSVSCAHYVVPHVTYLLAALMALRAEDLAGWRHALLRTAAVTLFFVSFVMNSLLVYHAGFLLLLVLLRQRSAGLPWYAPPWKYLLCRLDYILVSPVFYYWKRVFTPGVGNYADYNVPGFDPKQLWHGFKVSLSQGVAAPFKYRDFPLWDARWAGTALILIAAAVGVWLGRRAWARERYERDVAPAAGAPGLLGFGAVLLVLALFPYLAVNKPPTPWGNGTNYSALLPLPVGLLLVGLVRAGRSAGAAAVAGACAAVLAQFTMNWWDNYLSQEALHARNESIRQLYVRADGPGRHPVVVLVTDDLVPHTQSEIISWMWTYLMYDDAGGPNTFAVVISRPVRAPLPEDEVRTALRWSLLDFAIPVDPAAAQMMVVIKTPPQRPRPPILGARYLYYRWFRPAKLARLLDATVLFDHWELAAAPAAGNDVVPRNRAADASTQDVQSAVPR